MLNLSKICKFLKIRAERAKICNLYVKFDTKVEKRGYWVWTKEKKRIFRCKISVKKVVYLQAFDIHRHMTVTPPPPTGVAILFNILIFSNSRNIHNFMRDAQIEYPCIMSNKFIEL